MTSVPRGIRNNNPGNIERGRDRWIGMSADQSSDPRFVVFDTPEHGIRALMRLLINYQERHNLRTIADIVNRWAPPVGKDHSTGKSYTQNTSGYAQHVAKMTGFSIDMPLDLLDRDTCKRMAQAIVRHENGDPTPFGRPWCWYDDDVYERALVYAGFPERQKAQVQSTTEEAEDAMEEAADWQNVAKTFKAFLESLISAIKGYRNAR